MEEVIEYANLLTYIKYTYSTQTVSNAYGTMT